MHSSLVLAFTLIHCILATQAGHRHKRSFNYRLHRRANDSIPARPTGSSFIGNAVQNIVGNVLPFESFSSSSPTTTARPVALTRTTEEDRAQSTRKDDDDRAKETSTGRPSVTTITPVSTADSQSVERASTPKSMATFAAPTTLAIVTRPTSLSQSVQSSTSQPVFDLLSVVQPLGQVLQSSTEIPSFSTPTTVSASSSSSASTTTARAVLITTSPSFSTEQLQSSSNAQPTTASASTSNTPQLDNFLSFLTNVLTSPSTTQPPSSTATVDTISRDSSNGSSSASTDSTIVLPAVAASSSTGSAQRGSSISSISFATQPQDFTAARESATSTPVTPLLVFGSASSFKSPSATSTGISNAPLQAIGSPSRSTSPGSASTPTLAISGINRPVTLAAGSDSSFVNAVSPASTANVQTAAVTKAAASTKEVKSDAAAETGSRTATANAAETFKTTAAAVPAETESKTTAAVAQSPTQSTTAAAVLPANTQQSMTLPLELITEAPPSSATGTSTQAPASKETEFLPAAIAPPAGLTPPTEAQTLVQIGFYQSLNYPFVVSHANATAQIFNYLPRAVGFAMSVDPSTIVANSLRPYQMPGYVATVAYLMISTQQLSTLQALVEDGNSILYHQASSDLQSLVDNIDRSIPFLLTTTKSNTQAVTNPTTKSNNDASNSGSLADSTNTTSGSTAKKIAGIGLGAAFATGLYAAATFALARRYRRQQRLRPASRLTSQRSSRTVPISAPMNPQNTLGI